MQQKWLRDAKCLAEKTPEGGKVLLYVVAVCVSKMKATLDDVSVFNIGFNIVCIALL